jgi:hypothetical protein
VAGDLQDELLGLIGFDVVVATGFQTAIAIPTMAWR